MAPFDRYHYSWELKKRPGHFMAMEVWVYDTQAEMVENYPDARLNNRDVEGIFSPARANNGRYVGSIRLARDRLSDENIIHEAFHASFEAMRHLGRRVPSRYEESVVTAGAQLAALLLKDLKEVYNGRNK
jgi:hypothetical protein